MQTVATYVLLLSSEIESVRFSAAVDIGLLKGPEGVTALLDHLVVEPSRAVREAIFAALQQIEDISVIRGAGMLLQNEDVFLRTYAVTLIQSRLREALPVLEEIFATGDEDQRKMVIDILSATGDAATLPFYERALQDEAVNVVITAVEALGNAGLTKLRPNVEALLDPAASPMLIAACLETLAKIGDRDTLDKVREQLRAPVAGYLEGPYFKLLGALGGQVDVAELARGIAENTPSATQAVEALLKLHTRNPEVQLPEALAGPLMAFAKQAKVPLLARQAVRLLGKLETERDVLDQLCELREDPPQMVRRTVMKTLREYHAGNRPQGIDQQGADSPEQPA